MLRRFSSREIFPPCKVATHVTPSALFLRLTHTGSKVASSAITLIGSCEFACRLVFAYFCQNHPVSRKRSGFILAVIDAVSARAGVSSVSPTAFPV